MSVDMIRLAPGMAEAIAREKRFGSPEEAAAFWNKGADTVETQDMTYPGAAQQDQRLRLYRGGGSQALTFLYIHGGGWTGGSIELHDRSARGIAVHGACNVVSISYRLSPDHPYPAGLKDCIAACEWVEREGAALGLNPRQVAIGGASAGGNLAVAAALMRPGQFAGLLIFYGVLGCDLNTGSYLKYSHGPGLTRTRVAELFKMYDPGKMRGKDALISPLLSDQLDRLPPTSVIAAEHDVLLDDNLALAAALKKARVPCQLHVETGVTHGFINRGRLVPSADTSIIRAANFLRRLG